MDIRVYYEDTDCGGVVYHSNYLKYMERGRTELLRSWGIDLAKYHDQGLLWAVTEASLKYRHPGRYDDILTVTTQLTEVTSLRLIFKTTITNQEGTLCTQGMVKMVGFYAETGKVARFPAPLLSQLETHLSGGTQ